MAVTAALVKELREKTGVGMMECKKALVENSADMEKAILWLRERGLARANKKSGRAAAEGIVSVLVADDKKSAVLVEVNCETDFAAKNESFTKFVSEVSKLALETKANSAAQLAETKLGDSTVGDTLTQLIATVGENMTLRRAAYLTVDAGTIAGYSHMAGKIGTLVAISEDKPEVAKDVAMHTAAAIPKYLKREEVPADLLEQEKGLALKKLEAQGKTGDIAQKILTGQMNKFYTEICLLDQPFVKEPKSSVSKYVAGAGGGAITAFERFQLGEGVEKKQENFAEEVAAQLKK